MTTTTFQVEDYDTCRVEIDAYLPLHWETIAFDREAIPLDKDEESYRQLANDGSLHIVTVRQDGVLIGYIAGLVKPHLHYKSSLHCFTDVYFLDPNHRKGMAGVKLFREYERTLKARGVKKIFIGSKVHLDMSAIFERLGWRRTEIVYTKVI